MYASLLGIHSKLLESASSETVSVDVSFSSCIFEAGVMRLKIIFAEVPVARGSPVVAVRGEVGAAYATFHVSKLPSSRLGNLVAIWESPSSPLLTSSCTVQR